MTATQQIAVFTILAFLVSAEESFARDWRWHRRSTPSDSNVLRPDLEGIREDPEQGSVSEVEEMRQWLHQRDVERRQQGFTMPDTVEQWAPPEDSRMRPLRGAGREPSLLESEPTLDSKAAEDWLRNGYDWREPDASSPPRHYRQPHHSHRRTKSISKRSSRRATRGYHAKGGYKSSTAGHKSGAGRRR